MGANKKPLEGIKVVDLSTYVAAPACARMLADMGASVVKIEAFRGDPWRETAKACTYTDDYENPVFDIFNAGKQGICLDIKNPEGMEILMKMLADADIFITNTRLKSLVKLGLDYETLHRKFPRLIYGTITGYGSKGPDAENPGFDNVAYWTRSGFLLDMSIQTGNSYPVQSPTGSGDSVTAAMLYGGVMTALYQRTLTGEGDYVPIALYNTGIWVMASMIMQAQDRYHVKFPKERSDCSPFSSPYRCADGEWLCVTILDYIRYRDVVFKVLGIEKEMAAFDIPTQVELKRNGSKIIPIMEAAFAKKTAAEWEAELKAVDVVCSVMPHMRSVTNDEQALVNDFVQDYTFRSGESCRMPVPPIRLGSQEAPLAKSAPLVGEDTRTVLRGMGYSDAEIDRLMQNGAVK